MSAADWLVSVGADVFLPFGHSRDVDLVAVADGRALRIQVKTSTQHLGDRWSVSVCTRGGNRSWSGLVKYLDPTTFDWLFVLVADGRRWFIPANAVDATTAVMLGGPKYSEYEIEPGRPIREPAATLVAPWRGSRAVKGDAL